MVKARGFMARGFEAVRFKAFTEGERGIAIVTVMLLLLLTTSMLAGFLTVVSTDAKLRGVDRSRTQAFYAAHAGLEKLTADLGDLFSEDFAPEPSDLYEIEGQPPELENVVFEAQDGLGYKVGYEPDVSGNPKSASGIVQSGPYQGFVALQTPYTLTVTSRLVDGSEARLQRTLQTVSIPVFQFGIFSETDLSFFPGPSFDFGGRVHSNGHLFLATGEKEYADFLEYTFDTIAKRSRLKRSHTALSLLARGRRSGETLSVAASTTLGLEVIVVRLVLDSLQQALIKSAALRRGWPA